MREITPSELAEILEKHTKWLRGRTGGERANLSGANLRGANLSWANLSGANLSGANLSEANLSRADLWKANLSGANLNGADLWKANLSEANLSGANLRGANLRGADLRGAIGIYSMELSAHPIVVWFNQERNEYIVRVGCEEHSIDHWLAKYGSIGRKNYYSELQCEEYYYAFEFIKKCVTFYSTGGSDEED